MFVTIVAEVTAPPSTLSRPAHLPDEIYHPQALEQVAYPFSRGSARPRNQTGVSCIAGGLFTSRTTREAHSSSAALLISFASKTFMCPHPPPCREPGMGHRAVSDLYLQVCHSLLPGKHQE